MNINLSASLKDLNLGLTLVEIRAYVVVERTDRYLYKGRYSTSMEQLWLTVFRDEQLPKRI
jgi:hypothetical protein